MSKPKETQGNLGGGGRLLLNLPLGCDEEQEKQIPES